MNNSKRTPRGIRNNNPLNIRIGNCWWGEVENPTDTQFEQFKKMEYGIRAAFIILRRYIEKYGLNTVEQIISSWAPSSENNTKAYVKFVCEKAQIPEDYIIKYDNKDVMIRLVDAMIQYECGQQVNPDKVQCGYDIAHR